MQIEIQHSAFKAQRLSVEVAGAFHGPRLFLNGTMVKKQKRRYTVTTDAGTEITVQLKYNYLDPIPKVKIGEEVVNIASPLKWYEYTWIGIPFILIVTGGAIGGLCGGVAANASGRLFRSDRSSPSKYGFSALITLGAAIAYFSLTTIFYLLPPIADLSLDAELKKAVSAINKNGPMMADKFTRLDNALAGHKELTYFYTVLGLDDATIISKKDAIHKDVENNSRKNQDANKIIEAGVSMTYVYRNESGVELFRFSIK
ncbi:hypothetical protein [Methylotuvimicrobium alcaliphilum]|uniref:Uncharacterized protein n=1 Tax=Methylotuvimicrobium alcaliphilum (strain DSM 19304 / NCIMB 14124 / VKM B-2133 / 20Z) TaxID=1091494 RepID=G4T4M2_META2|nr:hypothetical protein [Methylotuvimicrobium alcaliphilum]CCE25778.1 protein of unknown function [Methylotuvimicrobium alcaliphilum 20Z]